MGFWKMIKGGLWDPQARAESEIETQITCFTRYMRLHPERDPNAWLALTLHNRPGWRGQLEFTYYTATALFSLAPTTQAPTALGLFILYKEEPSLAIRYSQLNAEIMAPIFELAATGEIVHRWRSINPWTATHFPEVAAGLDGAVREWQRTL